MDMHQEAIQKPRNRGASSEKEMSYFDEARKYGVPVWKAEFHTAVNNTDDVPETMFSIQSQQPSRKVQMWWLPGDGLFCLHKDKYFLIPTASVRYVKFI